MDPTRKHLQLLAADASVDDGEGPGSLCANVSMVGVPDDDYYPDVIFPGAFGQTFDRFLAEGFIALGHDWRGEPIAYPTLIEARGRAIYSEARYHSTERAQSARTVARERLAQGKAVGVSVGFYIAEGGTIWFESGEKLLAFARNNSYDMSLFDTEAVRAVTNYIRGVTRIARLAEWSQVNIPANPQAWATEAKGSPPGVVLQSLGTSRETKETSLQAWLASQSALRAKQAQRLRSLRLFGLGGQQIPPAGLA